MLLGPTKTALGLPGGSTPSGQPSPTGGAKPETDAAAEALAEMYQHITEGVTATEADATPATDPFALLRLLVEGSGAPEAPEAFEAPGAAIAKDFAPVPDLDALLQQVVAADPTLNTFADGTVEAKFAKLKASLDQRIAALTQALKQGMGTAAQLQTVQMHLETLRAARTSFDATMQKVLELKEQAIANYAKERELLTQVGLGILSPEQADLNHDGYYDDPRVTDYVLGYQTVDDVKTPLVLLKDTKKPVSFDEATGLPLVGELTNANYAWTITGKGLRVVESPDHARENRKTDLVLELDTLIDPQQSNGNHFGAQIDIAVPEYLWVRDGDDGGLIVKPFDGLTQRPPTAEEIKATEWRQLRVTDLLVDSDRPIGLNSTNPADGMDHIVTLKSGTQTLMKIRIAGRAFRTGQDPQAYGHHGFVAASSVGIAFHAGEGPNKRTSPINFTVEDSFVSTGRHLFDVRASEYQERFPSVAAGSSDDLKRKQGAIEAAVHQLSAADGDFTGGYSTNGSQTGIFVTGLFGNLKGSKFSDFFDIPDLPTMEDPNDPGHATTLDAGAGMNVILAGKGDHYIRGATFLDKRGTDSDITYVQVRTTTGVPTWSLTGDAGMTKMNPKVYLSIDTPGGTTLVDNGTEGAPDGTEDLGGDDYFAIQSGSILFANPLDTDRPPMASTDAVAPADIQTEFDSIKKKISDRVREKEETEAGDDVEFELDPLAEAEYYTQMKGEQDSIFAEFEAYWDATDDDDGSATPSEDE